MIVLAPPGRWWPAIWNASASGRHVSGRVELYFDKGRMASFLITECLVEPTWSGDPMLGSEVIELYFSHGRVTQTYGYWLPPDAVPDAISAGFRFLKRLGR
jgi:hypothetical protein